jgi:hypothetical protein
MTYLKAVLIAAAAVIFAGAVSAPARAELITYSLSFSDPDSAEPLPDSSGTITLNVPAFFRVLLRFL